MGFQQRCIDRMGEFKKQGATIVFVSHNLQAVAGLCDRALYLHRRGPRARAGAGTSSSKYVRAAQIARAARRPARWRSSGASSSTSTAGRRSPRRPGARLVCGSTYRAHAAVEDLLLGFLVYRSTDRPARSTTRTSGPESSGLPSLRPGDEIVVDFHFRAHLTRGQYHLGCHVYDTAHAGIHRPRVPDRHSDGRRDRTHSGIADLQVAPVMRRVRRHAREPGGNRAGTRPLTCLRREFSRGPRRLRRAVPAPFSSTHADSRRFSHHIELAGRLLNWLTAQSVSTHRSALCSKSVLRDSRSRCGCDD